MALSNGYRVRRDLASNWLSINPVLAIGELGYEKDAHKLKIGNGSTAWIYLPYLAMGAAVVVGTGFKFNTAANSGLLIISIGGL